MLVSCSSTSDTKCRPCGNNEYQPDWNNETKCIPQRFCDTVKGFSQDRVQNPKAAMPCRCMKGLQCSPTNCEFCERIPVCPPGQGLIVDDTGHGTCKVCPEGFFSDNHTSDPCRPLDNCKDSGKTEVKPGTLKSNAVCGPTAPASSTSEVLVAILSVIVAVSLLILTLFCYKDKMKLLSVNVRSCVQNLKRSRIQQETLAPPNNGPQLSCHEVTRLLRPDESSTLCSTTVLAIEGAGEGTMVASASATSTTSIGAVEVEDSPRNQTKQIPETVAAEVEDSLSPLSGSSSCTSSTSSDSNSSSRYSSCSCVVSMKEPVELGENEDCSEVVANGSVGICSCGSRGQEERPIDGLGDVENMSQTEERTAAVISTTDTVRETVGISGAGERVPEESPLCQNCCTGGGGQACCTDCTELPATQELYLEYSSLPEAEHVKSQPNSVGHPWGPCIHEGPLQRHNQQCCCSIDPTTTPAPSSINTSTNACTIASTSDQGQSLSCTAELKLSEPDVDSEYQVQCSETALTSGQVTGNNNATFISSGQVMNFSGEVIVVYVSQTSQGSSSGDEPGTEAGSGGSEPVSCPVQEESSDDPSLPSVPKSPKRSNSSGNCNCTSSSTTSSNGSIRSNSNSKNGHPGRTILGSSTPVQEMARRWPWAVK